MKLCLFPTAILPLSRDALRVFADALPFGKEERDRLFAIRNEKHLRESLAARMALAALMNEPSLPMRRTDDGKPYLDTPSAPAFNLSHTDGLSVALLSTDASAVGVDVEHLRPMPRRETIAHRLFTEEEQAAIRNAHDPDVAFLCTWTRKEAAVKCTGQGLAAVLQEAKQPRFVRTLLVTHGDRRFLLSVAADAPLHTLALYTPTDEIKIFEDTEATKEIPPCLIRKP